MKNSGGVPARPLSVYFDISEGPTVIPISGLPANATAEVKMELQSGPPSGVIIYVDYENRVVEGDESNNLLRLILHHRLSARRRKR